MTLSMDYKKYIKYTTKQGDTWTELAYRFYGNCFDYARLIMCNSSVAISPVIEDGTELIIPVFEDTITKDTEGLPVWKL